MGEAILQLAKGYEMIAASLRKLAESGAEVPKEDTKTEEVAPKTAEKPPKEKKKVTIADVRVVMAQKSEDGKTQEVRAIIKEFGADKLSAVPEEKLPDLLKKAEAL